MTSAQQLYQLQRVLSTHANRFQEARTANVEELRSQAGLSEETNRLAEVGKISGGAVGVGGGLAVIGGAVTAAFCAAAAPVTAPLIVIGGVVAAAGGGLSSACQLGSSFKNFSQSAEIAKSMREEREVMELLAKDLEQVFGFRTDTKAASDAIVERAWLLYVTYKLGARGVSCSPHHIAEKTEINDSIDGLKQDVRELAELGGSCSPDQIAEKSEIIENIVGLKQNAHELADIDHCQAIELARKLKIPGVESVLEDSGVLEMGAESAAEAIGEMIFDAVLPLFAILVPYRIYTLAAMSKQFNDGDYMKVAKAFKETADKLEKDEAKIVLEQNALCRIIRFRLAVRACMNAANAVRQIADMLDSSHASSVL